MNKLLFPRSSARSLRRFIRTAAIIAMLVLLFNLLGGTRGAAASSVTTYTGIIGGAAYKVEVPNPWNGVLVLYSHGYVTPGSPNPATDAGDPFTGGVLLSQGFALAGSSYSTTGWAVQQALGDQIALLDWFKAKVGAPQKTIAWGHSLGGLITAGLIQKHPEPSMRRCRCAARWRAGSASGTRRSIRRSPSRHCWRPIPGCRSSTLPTRRST